MINTKFSKRHRGVLNNTACFIFFKDIMSAWILVLLDFMNIYIYIHSLYNFYI